MGQNDSAYKHGYRQYPYSIQYGNGQNVGGHGGGEPDPQKIQDHLQQLMSVDNSMVWYVALIPLFGLAFEMFAMSRYLGFFLWASIIVIRILVCRYDNKKLIDMGLCSCDRTSKLVFLPVIYIFKRSRLLKRSVAPSLVAVACLYLAIIGNGFTEAATYNENNYYTFVSEYYSTYINDLPDDVNYTYNTYYTIDGLLNQYCISMNGTITEDSFVSYEYERSGEKDYVTATGTKDGTELSIVFLIDYDGYYYGGLDIEEVYLDGKPLGDEERDRILKEIFMLELEEK